MSDIAICVLIGIAFAAILKWCEHVNFKKGYEWATTECAIGLLDFPIDRAQGEFERLYHELSMTRGVSFANGAIERWTEIMSYTPKAD